MAKKKTLSAQIISLWNHFEDGIPSVKYNYLFLHSKTFPIIEDQLHLLLSLAPPVIVEILGFHPKDFGYQDRKTNSHIVWIQVRRDIYLKIA